MYITHIDEFFEGDTFFPDVNLDNWNSTEIMKHNKDNENPHNFKIMCYSKKTQATLSLLIFDFKNCFSA